MLLAYFLTFRTYGTWLHGDERGAVDREHNQVGEPLIGSNPKLLAYRRSLLKGEVVLLDEGARSLVEKTFREVASHRGWNLQSVKALSNHAHVLIAAPGCTADKVAADLKAWGTRRLREAGFIARTQDTWAYHGSTRYLNDEEAVERVRYYIEHCQEENDETANEPRA